MKNNTLKINLNEWYVDLLRFTGFPTPDFQIQEPSWWQYIVGEPSETKVFHPRKRQFQDKGIFKEGELILEIEPFRIDWIYRVTQSEFDQIKNSLGLLSEASKSFNESIQKWFDVDNFPTLQRLAFGALLIQPVKNRKSGYNRISKYLINSVKLDPESSSDFLYQINRPRDSKLNFPELKINRLTKWSVQTHKHFGVAVGKESKTVYESEESFACRLELDINTMPNIKNRFNSDDSKNIFNELVNLGIEIAEKGDTK